MFLAKTWTTRKGKKYPAWVLKTAKWDKEKKRMKQVYLAYVGKTKTIDLEKALKICTKLEIPLDELKKVKRLRVIEPKSLAEVIHPQPEGRRYPALSAQMMIRELRERHQIPNSYEGYEYLAVRIGVLHFKAKELQEAERGLRKLSDDQLLRLEQLIASKR